MGFNAFADKYLFWNENIPPYFDNIEQKHIQLLIKFYRIAQ